MMVIIFR